MQSNGSLTLHIVLLQETCTPSLVSIEFNVTKLWSGQENKGHRHRKKTYNVIAYSGF